MSNQQNWLSLDSGSLAARINPLGAQLSALKDGRGRDFMWNGDAAVWAGRAPLLFPIVGTLVDGSYRLGSRTYRLPRHGFARGKLFEVVNTTSTVAVFRLRSDSESLQVYPFHFELEVRFEVSGSTLWVAADVRNMGDVDMPASFGYHPAFRWPLAPNEERTSHVIVFEQDEPAPMRRLNAVGLMTAELHPTPIHNRRLMLDDSLFDADVMIFDRIRSRSVEYGSGAGPRVRVGYPDAQYLGVWSKPGANFVCIEPWRGVADVAGFCGDFRTKTGVFMVAPGAATNISMSIALL